MVQVHIEHSTSDLKNIKKLELYRIDYPIVSPKPFFKFKLIVNDQEYEIAIPSSYDGDFKKVTEGFSSSFQVPYGTYNFINNTIIDSSRARLYDANNFTVREIINNRLPVRMSLFEFGIEYSDTGINSDKIHKISNALTGKGLIRKVQSSEFEETLGASTLYNVFSDADTETIDPNRTTAINLITKELTVVGDSVSSSYIRIGDDSDLLHRTHAAVWNPIESKFFVYKKPLHIDGGFIFSSPDGVVWTLRASNMSECITRIIWSASLGIFIAAAVASDTEQIKIYTSLDGLTFTLRYTSAATPPVGMVTSFEQLQEFSSGVIYLGVNYAVYHTSVDGVNWTMTDNKTGSIGPVFVPVHIAYGNNQYIATGWLDGTLKLSKSSDLNVWNIIDTSQLNNYSYSHVTYHTSLSRFVIASNDMTVPVSGKIAFSDDDGVTWTFYSQCSALETNKIVQFSYVASLETIVGVAANTTTNSVMIITSKNGITWTKKELTYNKIISLTIQNFINHKDLIINGDDILLPEYWVNGSHEQRCLRVQIISENIDKPIIALINEAVQQNLIDTVIQTDTNPPYAVPLSFYPVFGCEETLEYTRTNGYALAGQEVLSTNIDQDWVRQYLMSSPPVPLPFNISLTLHDYQWLKVDDVTVFNGKPNFPYAFHAADFNEDVHMQSGFLNRCILELSRDFDTTDPLERRLHLKYVLSLILLRHKTLTDVVNLFEVVDVFLPHTTLDERFRSENAISSESVIYCVVLNRSYHSRRDSYASSIMVDQIGKNFFCTDIDNLGTKTFINFDRSVSKNFDMLLHFRSVAVEYEKIVHGNVTLRISAS